MKIVNQRVSESFAKILEAKKDRVRSGKYNPSSFGRCFRNQYWNRKNEAVTNPADLKGLKRMQRGTYSHNMIQSHFEPDEVEKRIELPDVLGFADIVLDDCVIDLKFTDDYLYSRFWKVPTEDIIRDKRESCYQVVFYAMMLQKEKAILRGSRFLDFVGVEHDVYNALIVEEVQSELNELRRIWDKQELPEAKPRAFGGKDCNFCNWADKCKEVENEGK